MSSKDTLNHNKKLCERCRGKNYLIQCKCGYCSEIIFLRDKTGRLRKYKKGHRTKELRSKSVVYQGYKKRKSGYIQIKSYDHPNKDGDNYVLQHRLIYEHYLKILFDEDVFIPREYEIHHIIPVKQGGSNALINLQLVTHDEHRALHKKNMDDRFCLLCGNKTRIDKKGHEHWYNYKDGFICHRCYNKKRKSLKFK